MMTPNASRGRSLLHRRRVQHDQPGPAGRPARRSTQQQFGPQRPRRHHRRPALRALTTRCHAPAGRLLRRGTDRVPPYGETPIAVITYRGMIASCHLVRAPAAHHDPEGGTGSVCADRWGRASLRGSGSS